MKHLFLFSLGCLLFAVPFAQSVPAKEIRYLSGTDNRGNVQWDFFCTGGRNSGYWTKIPVPSCWELQGFGAYNYGRDYKTYGRNFRFADEKGMYKYNFTVPAAWKNKRVSIVFEGSMTDTEVKINGQLAGPVHQGAFYRFSYDISDKLMYDKPNQLAVSVSKMSADQTVNNAERLADYWIFGGIFRPVYLEAVPTQYISYTAIDAKADGSFAMQVFLKGLKQAGSVVADLVDATGSKVATATVPVSAADSLATVRVQLSNPRQWTAEAPHLYRVNITLKSGTAAVYRTAEKFGFRTIEVRRGDGIYLNGVQIKMKGINRHCIWPETGRTLNDSIQLLDFKLLKEMNMNAVRCSHYPPDTKFLELCDSLGLYVLDELAGWQKAYGTPVGEKLVKEMVIKDVNHPSIIFWDNGNEGGTNKELDDDFLLYDFSKRPVIHPHHRPGNAFSGIDCNHYEDYYSTQKILADSLIYMPTEFLHSQDDGGAASSLAEFWELHWHAKRSGGGFIWAMLDEGVVRTDLNGIIDVNGVNAPDGVMGPHREKEGSFYAIREIYSPVKISLKDLPADFSGSIPVENRYHFTNLSACSFTWQLINFKKPGELATGYSVMKNGTALASSIAPGATGTVTIALPTDWKSYDGLTLSAYDPAKNLLYKWSWTVKSPQQLLTGILTLTDKDSTVATETDSTLQLKAGGITIGFDKQGKLIQVIGNHGDKMSFGNGPVMVSGLAAFKSSRHYREPDGMVNEVLYDGDLHSVRWKMYNSGWLGLSYEYVLNGSYPFTGLSFTYPENFVLGAKWLGKGPYRVWKNRMQGVTENVWQNAYNNTQTGSAPWTYPEFKGYYADISWMEMNTVEGKFLVASADSNLFVRLFDFYGISGVRPFPNLPPGNFSLLDRIPPIGTKLALNVDTNTPKLGPAGEWNKMSGTVKRTVYFYFGLPKSNASPQQYTAPIKDELF
ncbi:MAG: glycoside hydrolase family 2 [Williamsia sp.]|nr:glycoside hydrolase family 2 [Williamsia sp.]